MNKLGVYRRRGYRKIYQLQSIISDCHILLNKINSSKYQVHQKVYYHVISIPSNAAISFRSHSRYLSIIKIPLQDDTYGPKHSIKLIIRSK